MNIEKGILIESSKEKSTFPLSQVIASIECKQLTPLNRHVNDLLTWSNQKGRVKERGKDYQKEKGTIEGNFEYLNWGSRRLTERTCDSSLALAFYFQLGAPRCRRQSIIHRRLIDLRITLMKALWWRRPWTETAPRVPSTPLGHLHTTVGLLDWLLKQQQQYQQEQQNKQQGGGQSVPIKDARQNENDARDVAWHVRPQPRRERHWPPGRGPWPLPGPRSVPVRSFSVRR